MKAALVKIRDGRYFAISTKFLRLKSKQKGSFKFKGSSIETDCEVIGFNEEKHIFTDLAKNLNSNLPRVQIGIALSESLNSNILSASIVSFNEDLNRSDDISNRQSIEDDTFKLARNSYVGAITIQDPADVDFNHFQVFESDVLMENEVSSHSPQKKNIVDVDRLKNNGNEFSMTDIQQSKVSIEYCSQDETNKQNNNSLHTLGSGKTVENFDLADVDFENFEVFNMDVVMENKVSSQSPQKKNIVDVDQLMNNGNEISMTDTEQSKVSIEYCSQDEINKQNNNSLHTIGSGKTVENLDPADVDFENFEVFNMDVVMENEVSSQSPQKKNIVYVDQLMNNGNEISITDTEQSKVSIEYCSQDEINKQNNNSLHTIGSGKTMENLNPADVDFENFEVFNMDVVIENEVSSQSPQKKNIVDVDLLLNNDNKFSMADTKQTEVSIQCNSENEPSKENNNSLPTLRSGKTLENTNSVTAVINTSNILKTLDFNLNKPGTPQVNLKEATVHRSKVDVRREGKEHYCIFCKKFVVDQIVRHIQHVHADEQVIREASLKGAKVLSSTIEYYMNAGDYTYNYKIRKPEEPMLVSRKPNKRRLIRSKKLDNGQLEWPESIEGCEMIIHKKTGLPIVYKYDLPDLNGLDFVPCKDCFKMLRKTNVKRHKCNLANVIKIPGAKDNIIMCQGLIPDIHECASEDTRELVFKGMRKDDVRHIAVSDKTIVKYINDAVEYYSQDQNYTMLSHHARLLAELFLTCKKNTEPELQKVVANIFEFSDLLQVSSMPVIKQSIIELSGMDVKTKMIKKVNKPKDISYAVNKMLEFYIPYCYENKLNEKAEEATKFEALFKKKAKFFNKKSRDRQLELDKSTVEKKLPTTEEINAFCQIVEAKWTAAFNKLQNGFDDDAYKQLNESTALLLQLFNRRRQGELSRLELIVFQESLVFRIDENCKDARFTSLSEECKGILNDYYRVKLTNKRALRNVGLIIHKNLMESIQLLMKYRAEAGIRPENVYVFAKRNNNIRRHGYIILSDIMREYASSSGIKNHEALRGTHLRKQLATMMCSLQINENDLKQLANFLGHSYDIHTQVYRQEVPFRELVSVPQMLVAAQGMQIPVKNSTVSDEQGCSTNTESDESFVPSENGDLSHYENNSSTVSENNETMTGIQSFLGKKKAEKERKKLMKTKKRPHAAAFDASVDEVVTKRVRKGWSSPEKLAVSRYVHEHGIPDVISSKFIQAIQDKCPKLKARSILKIRSYISNTYGSKRSRKNVEEKNEMTSDSESSSESDVSN